MKSVICRAFGEPDTLTVQELHAPRPANGQVRIAVQSSSVNFFDILMVQGKYQRRPQLPFTPGTDAAGIVMEVGPDVTKVRAGDRVMAFEWMGGAFAEQMVAPEQNVFALPANIGYPAAAALKSVYGTALYALQDRARLRPGETLLVLGAAGGVGLALLDVGQVMGARVIAVVGSHAKAAALHERGIPNVIVAPEEDLRERVTQIAGRGGVDVIADPVGGDLFDQAIRVAGWRARVCVLGFASGRIPSLAANYALLKGFDLLGVNYGSWVDREPDTHRAQTEQLLNWCAVGKLMPSIFETYGLEDVAAAMEVLQSRSVIGKVLLANHPAARPAE